MVVMVVVLLGLNNSKELPTNIFDIFLKFNQLCSVCCSALGSWEPKCQTKDDIVKLHARQNSNYRRGVNSLSGVLTGLLWM